MLTVGSCAAVHHESGQIREEAALSGPHRVTQGGLARVHDPLPSSSQRFEGGGTITFRPDLLSLTP